MGNPVPQPEVMADYIFKCQIADVRSNARINVRRHVRRCQKEYLDFLHDKTSEGMSDKISEGMPAEMLDKMSEGPSDKKY